MTLRAQYALSFVCMVVMPACGGTGPATSTGSTSSSSSSGAAGTGGAGGTGGIGGAGGSGGVAMDDDVLCTALGAAGTHETLVAGADAMSAPLMAAPDVIHDVTIPQNGGYVALQLVNMHTTFVVYASDVETFEVSLDGTPVVESIGKATCEGLNFQRFQHHSHEPSKFVIALPSTPTNQSVIFYHFL